MIPKTIAERSLIVEEAIKTAPKFDHTRPVTRREAMAYAEHVYGDVKSHNDLINTAKGMWIGNYIYAVNRGGWTMPPDWTEGAACPAACPVPGVTFTVDNAKKHFEIITLLRKTQEDWRARQ